jgi:DNA-binding CsgD family transcriptional regulator
MKTLHLFPRAAQLLGRNGATADATTDETLAALATGVAILDDARHVVRTNRAMDDIIEARDGIRIGPTGLKLEDRTADQALQNAIGNVQNGANTTHEPIWLSAVRPSGRWSYTVAVSSLVEAAGDAARRVLVRISDPVRATKLDPKSLRALFSLTPAEARLVSALILHGRLTVAAVMCGLTEGSARQYVKRILMKTGTSSQVQLATLMAFSVSV